MLFSIKGPLKKKLRYVVGGYSEDVSDSSSPQFNLPLSAGLLVPGFEHDPLKSKTLWLNKIAERTQAHQLTLKVNF